MKNLVFLLIPFLLMLCKSVKCQDFDELLNKPENRYFKKYQLFNDMNYVLTLTTIDTTNSYRKKNPTIIVNLFRNNNNQIDTLINDSLFSRNARGADSELNIQFTDFNFDGIKDITLPAGTDPRGNYGLHLYVVNEKGKTIQYVDKFQEIGNPKPDYENQIIQSFVMSGPAFCNFYQIDIDKKLIDLDHYMEFNDLTKNIDSLIQNKIKEIKKE